MIKKHRQSVFKKFCYFFLLSKASEITLLTSNKNSSEKSSTCDKPKSYEQSALIACWDKQLQL